MNIRNVLNKSSIVLCAVVLSVIGIAGCLPESPETKLFEELPPLSPYDIKCYSNGNGLIYEGTSINYPRGSTNYGFYWKDAEGHDVKVVGDCVFIRLDNE